jgi:phage gpG-like protein
MRGIAAELASQTEQNFQNEGRPQWAELSDTATERLSKNGTWPGQILQVSAAGLAASITTYATDSSAPS